MYTPEAFKVEDRATLEAFMRQHSFATLVTHEDGSSHATHLPVVLKGKPGPFGSLRAHLARANRLRRVTRHRPRAGASSPQHRPRRPGDRPR